jgi:predicted dehydrogenase
MSAAPIGFGIVGLGMVADYHARAIAASNGGRLVGVVSRSADKARAFAESHGAILATDQLSALLARSDVDVVCIATPNGAHLEPAVAAAAAGKHLVVEKPLEITLERTDRIIAAAAAAGVRLAPIFQSRFGEGAQALKRAVAEGRFGRLALCSAYVKWQRTPAYYADSWHGRAALDGGGVAMNQAIHAIDLLQWLVGLPVEVTAVAGRCTHHGIEVEDTLAAVLRFGDGAMGTIEASTAVFPGWAQAIELCGEHGSARLEDDRLVRWDFRDERPEDAALRATAAGATLRSGAAAPNAIGIEGHRRQIQNLIDALRGTQPLALDGAEARKAVALVRALYDSAERHGPVRLRVLGGRAAAPAAAAGGWRVQPGPLPSGADRDEAPRRRADLFLHSSLPRR